MAPVVRLDVMRKSPFAGLSWLQLIAGALAAMTSAWVASYLGVAGTVIGAAVGSLVASIASALYARGLDRGTTLITESGSVVTRASSADGAEESEVIVAEESAVVAVEDPTREFSWKRTLTWAGIALASALVIIGGYELITGSAFGNADEPAISRPWSDDGKSDEKSPAPNESEPSSEPTDEPTKDAPTTPAPSTGPTAAPTTPAPTEPPAEPSPQVTQEPLDGAE